MARTNIKTEINSGSIVTMITLSESVTKKHESYDARVEDNPRNDMGCDGQSPLHHLNMGKFKTDTISAKNFSVSADELHAQAEGLSLRAHTIMGFAFGQTIRTPDTLYFEVDKIRGLLLSGHSGDEKQLEQYGFNVVISKQGSKATVKVEIPVKHPDKFMMLCEGIIKKYISLGAVNPLHHLAMGEFQVKTNNALALLIQARELHKKAQGETQLAYTIVGIYKDQTIRTQGTLYFMLDKIRGLLLKVYKGREEQLEQWGFNIVITETMPGKKPKPSEDINLKKSV